MAVLEKEVGGGIADNAHKREQWDAVVVVWKNHGLVLEPVEKKKVLRCIFCWRISNPPKMFHLALSTITQPNYSFHKRWCTIVAHRAIQ